MTHLQPLPLSEARFICSQANFHAESRPFLVYAYNELNNEEKHFLGKRNDEFVHAIVNLNASKSLFPTSIIWNYFEYDIVQPSLYCDCKTNVKLVLDNMENLKFLVNSH